MSGTSPRILLLHIPPMVPLRRIYRPADCRHGILESTAGRSFDPSAEGAMTAARPPLSLIICPCLSLLSTDYSLNPCCRTLRRCRLTVGTLCLRREEWDHDPPALTSRKSYVPHTLYVVSPNQENNYSQPNPTDPLTHAIKCSFFVPRRFRRGWL